MLRYRVASRLGQGHRAWLGEGEAACGRKNEHCNTISLEKIRMSIFEEHADDGNGWFNDFGPAGLQTDTAPVSPVRSASYIPSWPTMNIVQKSTLMNLLGKQPPLWSAATLGQGSLLLDKPASPASSLPGPRMADGVQEMQQFTSPPALGAPLHGQNVVNEPINMTPTTDNSCGRLQDDQIGKPVAPNAPKEPGLRGNGAGNYG